jgi:hypothetical protein
VKYFFKTSAEPVRKRIKRWIIGSAIVLFFPLVLLYISYLFGIALDDHYDVKKGTFLWYATMDNKTITGFPVIEPIGNVTYNKIGGDGPNIATGWEIKYQSRADIDTLTKEFVECLKSDGYELKAVDETQFYWTGKNKKNEMNRLYSGSNEKGESLDLLLQRQNNGTARIECSIVY